MRVLVTGGAGYVGSEVVRLLRRRDVEVVVLDTLEHGRADSVADAQLIEGSCGDRALLKAVFGSERIDAVIHMAAFKSVEESVRSPGRYFENNVCASLELINATIEASVTSFVYSSTCAVYGTCDVLPVDESAPTHPENPYGESKLMVERILRWYEGVRGFHYASLRYFNAAGASVDGSHGEDPTASESLVPVAIRAAVRRRPIDVFGTDYPTPDGTAIRDYVHIVDLAEAHVHAIDFLAQHQRSVTANLGTGQGTSVTQVLDAVRRITGIDVPIRARPRRQGDIPAIWADTSFARQTLGWRPRMQIDEIVLTTWRWFLRSEQRGLRSSAKASEPSPARASCET